jgi:hypothetical protein
MSKLLALATALIFAATTFASTAQAGMRVGIGIGIGGLALGAMSNGGGRGEAREYRERKRERASRRVREEKAPVRSAKKSKSDKSEKTEQAAKEPESAATNEASAIATTGGPIVAPVTTGATATADAQTEHSSISLASATDDAAPVKKIDTASQETTGKSLDCKKFFPSVGMTLSVPCE